MATSATSSNLPPDIIHEILVQVSDSSTLSAAIRVCSRFYNVFQARPNQILHAILGNVVGPALPQAQRLAYCQTYLESTHDPRIDALLDESYFQGGKWKPDRTLFMRMEEQAKAARVLEDFYSLRHKDRTSLSSKLDATEALRFHRALYRYWFCYAALVYDEATEGEDDDDDDDEDGHDVDDEDDPSLNKVQRKLRNGFCDFFREFPSEQLFELMEMCTFLKDAETWQGRAVYILYAATFQVSTPVDPLRLARALETRGRGQRYEWNYDHHGLITAAALKLLRARKVPEDRLAETSRKAIVTAAFGAEDRCSRCQAVCGTELLGPTNMYLVAGLLEQALLLPGLLHKNAHEMSLLRILLSSGEHSITDEAVVQEMMDMSPEGEYADNEHWSKDEWYCLECIKQLFRQRFMLWWRETKRRNGAPIQEDCWYGYNCRTMTHKSSHATKLNHLCKPTRGEAPNAGPVNNALPNHG